MTFADLFLFRRRVLVAIGRRIAERRDHIRDRAERQRRINRVRRLPIPEVPR